LLYYPFLTIYLIINFISKSFSIYIFKSAGNQIHNLPLYTRHWSADDTVSYSGQSSEEVTRDTNEGIAYSAFHHLKVAK